MIRYIKVQTAAQPAEYVLKRLKDRLQAGQTVFWMVAGGSAIKIAVDVSEILRTEPNLKNLTITLTDERYGPVNHPNSNLKQLLATGFDLPGAHLLPVLNGESMEETATNYAKMLNRQIGAANYSLALAGMGPDGHIFGIKPYSPSVNSEQDVVGYNWDDYKRITPTLKLIRRLDEIVVYAVGQEKWSQFDKLEKVVSPGEQPAQLLKKMSDVTIFNDYKGEKYEDSN
ncbi:MAG TPA: 6-phosphogluconolactonase [Candidatus Saccharimonadales bacterium]|nr:6-phosphogluconolactonase [Candidatus Saccharimonadales bacterium]